jgi:hypothetical protein
VHQRGQRGERAWCVARGDGRHARRDSASIKLALNVSCEARTDVMLFCRIMTESALGDRAARVTRLLFERSPICAACMSRDANLVVGDVEPIIGRVEHTICVKRDMGECRCCERWTLVYSLLTQRKPR